jgi:hypothetical protein
MKQWIGFFFVTSILISCVSASDPVAVQLTTSQRAPVPGEPLRVEANADRPLESLAGEFLGESFPLFPAGDGRWIGWTMIPLDQEPGTQNLRVDGKAAGGAIAHGSIEVTVAFKKFPEESLKVAPKYVEPPKEVQERLQREQAKLVKIYARRSAGPTEEEPFLRPVPGPPTSVFGTRRIFNGQARDPHSGWDLDAETGDPILAAASGQVVLAQDLYYSGNIVILDHGFGRFTLYAHLSEIGVKEGQQVARGELLGKAGATGRVTGPHLHWGAKIGDKPFDPAALLDPALFGR